MVTSGLKSSFRIASLIYVVPRSWWENPTFRETPPQYCGGGRWESPTFRETPPQHYGGGWWESPTFRETPPQHCGGGWWESPTFLVGKSHALRGKTLGEAQQPLLPGTSARPIAWEPTTSLICLERGRGSPPPRRWAADYSLSLERDSLTASKPCHTMNGTIARLAIESDHHHPARELSSNPTRSVADMYAHNHVSTASASKALLPISRPVRRLV